MSLVAAGLVPCLVSLFVCWLMIRLGPKDAPDGGRKTQGAPVPSSGGVGIVAGIAASLAALAALGADVVGILFASPLIGLAGFAVFAALLGWLDDARGLPALAKLVALLGGAVAAALAGTSFGWPWGAGVIVAAGWMFVMANAVNFMDGANGIAMGTALIILSALVLVMTPLAALLPGAREYGLLMALLLAAAAAAGGFLYWNLGGKLYAGDAGALSVGGLIGAASIVYAREGSVFVPLTLALPLLVDVFMTLAWRARRGRPLMQAHRDHAYQLLLRAGWPHLQVARLWWGMTAVCAGAVIAGPFAASIGAYDGGGLPLDVGVFCVLLVAGCALWLRQRASLGRQLEAEGK